MNPLIGVADQADGTHKSKGSAAKFKSFTVSPCCLKRNHNNPAPERLGIKAHDYKVKRDVCCGWRPQPVNATDCCRLTVLKAMAGLGENSELPSSMCLLREFWTTYRTSEHQNRIYAPQFEQILISVKRTFVLSHSLGRKQTFLQLIKRQPRPASASYVLKLSTPERRP